MKVDYIIVGLGLAGLAFSEKLEKENKSFLVFENNSQNSSLVAGGICNPVILKRFTPVWKAKEQLAISLPFYDQLEKKLQIQIDQKFLTRKVFKSKKDQNNWFVACDNPLLSDYLNTTIYHEKIKGIIGDFGFGEVINTGRINTSRLIECYRNYLSNNGLIRFQRFDYNQLEITKKGVVYSDVEAEKIVFCEGFGVKKNPFFRNVPLKEAKGELITIHAPDLKIDFLVKSTLFVLPLGEDLYKVGATFNWEDKTSKPTKEGRKELVEKLKRVIDVPYKIVDQEAGIRPTVKDRRPLVGVHPEYKQLAILNGLGTRGVMIAPWAANQLYEHIALEKELDSEIDIKRFS